MGVDVGEARVGLATSDPDGLMATPVETLARDHSNATGPSTSASTGQRGRIGNDALTHDGAQASFTVPADVARIVAEVQERLATVVYVGLPRHLSGAEGAATESVRIYAATLAVALADAQSQAEVRLIDERMTTVTAHQLLHAAGRSSKRHRAVVDQVAAVVILQSALDAERSRSARAGELVQVTALPGAGGDNS